MTKTPVMRTEIVHGDRPCDLKIVVGDATTGSSWTEGANMYPAASKREKPNDCSSELNL